MCAAISCIFSIISLFDNYFVHLNIALFHQEKHDVFPAQNGKGVSGFILLGLFDRCLQIAGAALSSCQ